MIRSVEITNFRGIQSGKLEDFTPLTILVGPNGSGKSAIIESVFITANPSPHAAVVKSATRRGLLGRWLFWKEGREGDIKIHLTATGSIVRECELKRVPSTLPEGHIGDQSIQCIVRDIVGTDSSEESELFVHFSRMGCHSDGSFLQQFNSISDIRIVNYDSEFFQTPLHQLFTQAVAQGYRQKARIPELDNIEILTEGDTPLIFLVFSDYAIPVTSAGDGVQTLLRVSLELASLKEGIALLEEPEVHQHPGAINQSAKAIWAAVRRGIQVIISTHSLELIDYLLSEVNGDEELEKLSVYSLRLNDGCLKSYRVPGPDVAFKRVQIGDDLR
jgi:energy-coupling factor transporter ATP-binding protein EcfA2